MKVILVYDICVLDEKGQYRLSKVLKIARKYLHHVQRSVFEGNLTEGKLKMLESEISSVIDLKRDCVIIYTLPDGMRLERKILTESEDPTSNII